MLTLRRTMEVPSGLDTSSQTIKDQLVDFLAYFSVDQKRSAFKNLNSSYPTDEVHLGRLMRLLYVINVFSGDVVAVR